jgi:hypothetical protein
VVGHDLYYRPQVPAWDDGTPIPNEVTTRLKQFISEIDSFWGSTAEFRQLGR